MEDLKHKSSQEIAQVSFDLYQSLGYPNEIFLTDLEEAGIKIERKEFVNKFKEIFDQHQKTSRAGSEQKFKGGLADQDDITVKYHTTTHLLQAALREVLGPHVSQKGSNITTERLRFDYSHPDKLTEDQIKKVENYIKDKIEKELPVYFEVLNQEEAKRKGASFMEHENYPDKVKVYVIGKDWDSAISKELCGGPHVDNTSQLKPIEIYKQKNIGEGKNRIYAKFIN